MSIVIRAHYDGNVIVPDEPVGEELELAVVSSEHKKKDKARHRAALKRIGSRVVPADIPLEALDRENLYGDRL